MARTTTNLGLKVWDNALDEFHWTELRDNWDAIDIHDHTGGVKGLPIGATALQAGAVIANKIAVNAIASDKLQDSAVITAKIAAANVTKSRLATDALDAFLKLAATGDHKVNFGRFVEPSWTATSHSGTIPHGLGGIPVFALVHPDTASGTLRVGSITSVDATNIAYKVEARDGTSLTSVATVVNWIAIL